MNPFFVPDKSPPIFSLFKPASFDTIKQLILSSPKSTSQYDPITSNLLFYCIDNIVTINNYSYCKLIHQNWYFPNEYKSAFVKPLLKTLTFDSNDLKNYHPISNLSFQFKLTEHVIVYYYCISSFVSHNLASKFKSAYRKFHLCKTALLCVRNDIFVFLNIDHSTELQLSLCCL